jgi:hypothetical protein
VKNQQHITQETADNLKLWKTWASKAGYATEPTTLPVGPRKGSNSQKAQADYAQACADQDEETHG